MDFETAKGLADGGALIAGFAVLLYIIGYYTTKLSPALDALTTTVAALTATVQSNKEVTDKLLEGNATAFRELSMSNYNVATALSLLTKSMESQDGALARHEALSNSNFNTAISRTEDVMRTVEEMRRELTKHVTTCDTRYGRTQHP